MSPADNRSWVLPLELIEKGAVLVDDFGNDVLPTGGRVVAIQTKGKEPMMEQSKTYKRGGFTEQEDQELKDAIKTGLTPAECAVILQRHVQSVRGRANLLHQRGELGDTPLKGKWAIQYGKHGGTYPGTQKVREKNAVVKTNGQDSEDGPLDELITALEMCLDIAKTTNSELAKANRVMALLREVQQ